jgi:pyruvate dehydrogenase kinase 2/3/4
LHIMLMELLKNSFRASIENCNRKGPFPDIKLIIARGDEDITIKISDEGGGIPRSAMPLVWTYMYSTARSPQLDSTEELLMSDGADPGMMSRLAGYGYGLPLCRLYAKYFGGDLKLISMEGYGTDAYLHLRRLSNSQEALQS